MKMPLLRSSDIVTTNEIFRLASLFLYIILLLHVVLAATAHHLLFSGVTIAALILLAILFCIGLGRYIWPKAVAYGQGKISIELLIMTFVVGMLTLQGSMPSLQLSWLIGAAGVFPLALRGVYAIGAVLTLMAAGLAINLYQKVPYTEWLLHTYATLFVGLLAILLARALHSNQMAIHQAHRNNRRFDAIARATRHVFLIVDAQYKVIYVNPALQEVIGYSEDEVKNNNIRAIVHPEDADEHREKLRFLRDTPRSSIFSRHRTQHKDGQWVWVEACGFNMLHDPAIQGLVFSIEDITAHKEAELKLAAEHALLRAVLDHNPSMIYATDTTGHFTISNLSYQRRYGYSSEEDLRGKTIFDIFAARVVAGREVAAYEMADSLNQQDLRVMQTGVPLEDLDVQGLNDRNARVWYRTNKYPLRNEYKEVVGVLGITSDITDRKEYELRLEHQALHDPLTGLPNRTYLLKAIADAIVDCRTSHGKLAMLFCDLDFFKSVNDTHGHDFGDKCLLEITRRILLELPPTDFVARHGGNEFVILTNASLLEARLKAENLLRVIGKQLVVDDVIVKLQSSIGIALLRTEHVDPAELIRDADAAMYQAKERGRNRVEIFDASLQNNTTKRAQMDVALRFALERSEFTIVYQPKVSLLEGTVKGFELLLRWNSPQYGHISPTEFIPIAETSGVVVQIGLWTLEEGCKQLSAWQAQYQMKDVTLAVNVSMRQLMTTSFLAEVTDILERTGVSPGSLELELTETSAMANPVETIEKLTMLKKLGLRLALDDFGTGYSSLAYLQKLPVDVLKIDKAFVHGVGKNAGDTEIVRLILALAETLKLDTIAEGVETKEHVIELIGMGCYLGQGFVFSPAMSAEDAGELLRVAKPFSVV